MERTEILKRINEIFCDVFDEDDIVIDEKTNSGDIEDWDSLTNITLINLIETTFSIRFTVDEITEMKNVGEMMDIIQKKMQAGGVVN